MRNNGMTASEWIQVLIKFRSCRELHDQHTGKYNPFALNDFDRWVSDNVRSHGGDPDAFDAVGNIKDFDSYIKGV